MGADAQIREIKSLKREQITLRGGARGARRRVARRRLLLPRVERVRGDRQDAATSRGSAIPASQVRTVRRAFPASSEPVPVPGASPIKPADLNRHAAGRRARHRGRQRALDGHADPGYDAVDRDRDPKPGEPATAARRRAGPRSRASSPRSAARAADPDRLLPRRRRRRRGPGDHRPAARRARARRRPQRRRRHLRPRPGRARRRQRALRGLHQLARGRSRRGRLRPRHARRRARRATRARRRPAAARSARPRPRRDSLAVGALAGREPQPRTTLTLDGEELADAAALAGDPPPDGQTAGPVTGTDTAALGKALTRIRDKVVIVKAGANPPAQAAAAAAVGARAVVIAAPGERAAAGPVRRALGGPGDRRDRRRRACKLSKAKPGTAIAFGDTERGAALRRPAQRASLAQQLAGTHRRRPAQAGSRGATASALSAGNGGRRRRDRRERGRRRAGGRDRRRARPAAPRPEPGAAARDADRRRPAAGASRPTGPARARRRTPSARSPPTRRPRSRARCSRSRSTSRTTASGSFTFQVPRARPAQPPSALAGPGHADHGQRAAGEAQHGLRPPRGPPGQRDEGLASRGSCARTRSSRSPSARSRSPAGAACASRSARSSAASRREIQVAERLVLDLVDAKGNVRRSLTVKGGARDLMPAEYAYAIPRARRCPTAATRSASAPGRRARRSRPSSAARCCTGDDGHALLAPRLPPVRGGPGGARARPRPRRRSRSMRSTSRPMTRCTRAISSGSPWSRSTARSCSSTSSTRRL